MRLVLLYKVINHMAAIFTKGILSQETLIHALFMPTTCMRPFSQRQQYSGTHYLYD